jgi:hypothetical protein
MWWRWGVDTSLCEEHKPFGAERFVFHFAIQKFKD